MIVSEVFKVYLYPDPLTGSGIDPYPFEEGEDITSGIINVNIVQGTDLYEGPQEQIDTGQFTIISRNPNLDPKINTNLKYNSRIQFWDERTGEFFRGYVTDIQVEYQRKDDPIITITGTDIFGAMQRVVIDQDTHNAIMALSTGPTWNGLTFTEFIPYMSDFTSKYLDIGINYIGPPGYPTPAGFWFDSTSSFGSLTLGNLAYSPAKYIPQVGETYLEVINKYAQTNLTSFSAKSGFGDPMSYNYINVTNFPKYDPNYWNPQEDPMITYTTYDFSSDPVDNKPYRSILLDNGYSRVINQVDISNEYRFVDAGELKSESESFTRISDQSFEDYAISRASVSTIYPEDAPLSNATWANRYSQNIFQITAYPNQEIQQITFDNARLEDIENDFSYSDYNLNQMVRIKHEINNDNIIDRIYDIAGISHDISPDNWEMTFTLKPNAEEVVFQYQGSVPTLEMNATTGDTNFNFTATLIDFDPSTVSQVFWALSATNANEIASIYPYAVSGRMFKDNLIRSGFTQTWNFDDDGILAPYSFDPDSIFEEPTDNRYGGYGSGNWNVYAFITLTNRFTVVLQQPLVVGTPEVEADFGWTQNLTNNFGVVSFVNTSVNNETGEVDSYAWDFGDGNTSALENPVHQYSPAPDETEYDVSLTVFAYGEDEEKIYSTHTETVTLIQPEMTADFTWVANAQVVTFTNTSTNVGFEEPDAYLWEFGDGTTSTLKNPVHTFPVANENVPESFSVKLTTRNIWEQTADVTKTVTTTALNKSGTFPVRYIKLFINTYQKAGTAPIPFHLTVTPVMSVLKATTSGTGVNLAYLKPAIGFNDNSIPRLFWLSTDGANVQQSLGWEYFLTRDIQTNARAYGLGAASKGFVSSYYKVRWEVVIDLGENTQLINNLNLRFEDLIDADLPGQILTEDFYPEIFVQFATTVGGYIANPSDVYGPPTLQGNWVTVGSFRVDGGRMDPTKPAGQRTNTTKSITPRRPLPLNTPYFLYGFNDKTVDFYSIEEADSYAWTFGNGTTATGRTPSVTYADYGTYNVTLEVTTGGIVTRTTTEPVIVRPPWP